MHSSLTGRFTGCVALSALLAGIFFGGCAEGHVEDAERREGQGTGCNPISIATVSASTAEDVNPAAQAVDGDLSTRWSGYGSGATITADLGTSKNACAVSIAWYRGDLRTETFDI